MKRAAFFFTLLFCLSLVSCEKETLLNVSQTSLSFADSGGSLSLPFIANKSWVASASENWCHVSPSSGDASETNNVSLTVSCDANDTFDDRVCIITVACMELSKTVQVQQTKNKALVISQTSYDLTNAAQTITIEVKSNIAYEYFIDGGCAQWVKVASTKGLSTNMIAFDIARNEDYDAREGKITFVSNDGAFSSVVNIRQSQENGLFILTPEYSLSNAGHNLTIEVKSNVDFEVRSETDWIRYVETKGLHSSQIVLEVSANDLYDSREGKVSVKQKGGDLSGTIKIRQEAKKGLSVSQNEFSLSAESQMVDVEVMNNVDFDVIIPDYGKDWVKVIQTKGLHSTIVTFSVAKNESFDGRECSVTFKQKNGSLSETVSIRQEAGVGLFVSPPEYLLSNERHVLTVEVQSNVVFEVESQSEWIQYVETKGLQTSQITLVVAANESYDSREGRVVVKQANGNLSGIVTIRQEASQGLFLSKRLFELSSEAQSIEVEVTSNIDLEVIIPDDCKSWIQMVNTRGLNSKYITFSIAGNATEDAREGSITFKQRDGLLCETVFIQQEPKASLGDETLTSEPHFKETVELMCLIWRLAGASEYNTCQVSAVAESADAYFASMKNHKAVSLAKEYYNKSGISYEAVTAYGLNLIITDQGTITFNPNYIQSSCPSLNRWTARQMQNMLTAVNDFYQKSDFHSWYKSFSVLRQRAVLSFKKIGTVDFDWFSTFFRPLDNTVHQLLLSFLIGINNNGLSLTLADGRELLSPIMGSAVQDGMGEICYGSSVMSTLIHELCHPFCNPLIESNWTLISDKAEAVYPLVSAQLWGLSYSNSLSMMYETFVRSCVIRYMMAHPSSMDTESMIQEEKAIGFMMVPLLVDVLEKRVRLSAQYVTMEDFMPEIVTAINGFVIPTYSGQYEEYTQPDTPNLLPGVFSVGDNKKVRFTKGNLYWNGNGWRFESNQMNYPNEWDPNHIGHFYWTTTASESYDISYMHDTVLSSPYDRLFCDGSDEAHQLSVEGITGLRVLSDEGDEGEITYLLKLRKKAGKLRRFPVEIKNVGDCLVIAPDDYEGTIASAYDAKSWAEAEAAGLVCLSPNGYRMGTEITDILSGHYWSSTLKDGSDKYAHILSFSNSIYTKPSYSPRHCGYSIRLVQDVKE